MNLVVFVVFLNWIIRQMNKRISLKYIYNSNIHLINRIPHCLFEYTLLWKYNITFIMSSTPILVYRTSSYLSIKVFLYISKSQIADILGKYLYYSISYNIFIFISYFIFRSGWTTIYNRRTFTHFQRYLNIFLRAFRSFHCLNS